MSVSTEYFDFVFETKAEVADNLQASITKLENREAKVAELQSLVDEKASKKRLKRLAKWTALLERQEVATDALIGRLNTLEAVELPKDEVSYSLINPRDGVTGIQVTVTDSPYDDTFVGGEQTGFTLRGSGKETSKGSAGYGSYYGIIPESFEDDTATFGIASVDFAGKVDGSYPDVTATLQGVVTPIVTDGEVVI